MDASPIRIRWKLHKINWRETTMKLLGKAHVYGNNIDTDRIIPGKYTKTLNLRAFANHVLEDLDPDFRKRLKHGDIIIGGDNFGCGSSREQAPLAIKTAGVSCVRSEERRVGKKRRGREWWT